MTDPWTILQSGGIAAIVAIGVVYILRKFFESGLEAHLQRELEKLKAENSKRDLYLQELVKKQSAYYPDLATAVYRARNAARELLEGLPEADASTRSEFGNLALRITESLYEYRAFLPGPLFDDLHGYKRRLQDFVFNYDMITGGSAGSQQNTLGLNLTAVYREIDNSYAKIADQIQTILQVKTGV